MKRYKLYDPKEYVDWKEDPALVDEFDARFRKNSARETAVEALTAAGLLGLYRGLLRFRLHDIMLARWVRQGVLTKAWLATGEEAVTIGSVHALSEQDSVGPMIRNAGACHERGIPLWQMFAAYLGTAETPMRGRDLHLGDHAKGVVAPISHVGALVPVMGGIALSCKLKTNRGVALTYVGDGATQVGEVHEALGFAAERLLPLIVIIQANQVAMGTPTSPRLASALENLGSAYGIPLIEADGNNVLDVYGATQQAVERGRSGAGPTLVLAKTFRMGGHATHDQTEGRRILHDDHFAHYGKRDPVGLYEAWLSRKKAIPRDRLESLEAEVVKEVDAAAERALESSRTAMPSGGDAATGVFAADDRNSSPR